MRQPDIREGWLIPVHPANLQGQVLRPNNAVIMLKILVVADLRPFDRVAHRRQLALNIWPCYHSATFFLQKCEKLGADTTRRARCSRWDRKNEPFPREDIDQKLLRRISMRWEILPAEPQRGFSRVSVAHIAFEQFLGCGDIRLY